jgi:hypothetical protein
MGVLKAKMHDLKFQLHLIHHCSLIAVNIIIVMAYNVKAVSKTFQGIGILLCHSVQVFHDLKLYCTSFPVTIQV